MTIFGIDTHQTNTSRALWLGAATLIVGLAVIVSVDWWVSPAVAILVHLAMAVGVQTGVNRTLMDQRDD